MKQTIVVPRTVDEELPAPGPETEYVLDRRRPRPTLYVGRDRRRSKSARLERLGSGLAVVRTCPDCGRVSIVPWTSGGGAAPVCACARATAGIGPRRLRAIVVTGSLVLLWLLNLEDVALTHSALALGAVEVNVVMNFFLRYGFAEAALIKMAVVTLGSLYLWSQRRHTATLVASVGLATVYTLVVVFQVLQLAAV